MSFYSSGAYDQDGDPEYVYYNGLIINNKTGFTADFSDPPVKFQETRSVPIISDAAKYQFSIVRANVNGPNINLPLFIPTLDTAQLAPYNINKTIYTVTLTMDFKYTLPGPVQKQFTTTQTAAVIWEPENSDLTVAAPPTAPLTGPLKQDLGNRYYWCYTYSHWLGLVNKAFATARNQCETAFKTNWSAPGPTGWGQPALTAPPIYTQPCKITYNPDNNKFSLYADAYSFGDPIPGGPPTGGLPVATYTSLGSAAEEKSQLWFNNNMYGLFANFYSNFQNLNADQQYRIWVYPVLFQNGLTVAIPAALQYPTVAPFPFGSAGPVSSVNYYIMIQDFPSTSTLWSPIESIVFTSTMLPLVFEQTGNPVTYGNSNNNALTTSDSAFQPIITDISLTNETSNDYKSFIQYLPTAEYRLTSFQRSKVPIGNIDIQIFWKNRLDGSLYPLYLYNGSSVSIKCMFRRKDAAYPKA